MGVLVMSVGTMPLLLGLGVIKAQNASHVPLFVVGAVGVALIMAGIMILTAAMGMSQKSWLSRLLGFLLICSFLTPFAWIALFSSQALMFRLAFGAPVVLFVLLYFARYIPGVKVISADSSAEPLSESNFQRRKKARLSRKL